MPKAYSRSSSGSATKETPASGSAEQTSDASCLVHGDVNACDTRGSACDSKAYGHRQHFVDGPEVEPEPDTDVHPGWRSALCKVQSRPPPCKVRSRPLRGRADIGLESKHKAECDFSNDVVGEELQAFDIGLLFNNIDKNVEASLYHNSAEEGRSETHVLKMDETSTAPDGSHVNHVEESEDTMSTQSQSCAKSSSDSSSDSESSISDVDLSDSGELTELLPTHRDLRISWPILPIAEASDEGCSPTPTPKKMRSRIWGHSAPKMRQANSKAIVGLHRLEPDKAAIRLQRLERGRQARYACVKRQSAVLKLQTWMRGREQRVRFQQTLKAALCIQLWCRHHLRKGNIGDYSDEVDALCADCVDQYVAAVVPASSIRSSCALASNPLERLRRYDEIMQDLIATDLPAEATLLEEELDSRDDSVFVTHESDLWIPDRPRESCCRSEPECIMALPTSNHFLTLLGSWCRSKS